MALPQGRLQEIGWAKSVNPGFPSLSLHRVFKKASPNGKVSLWCVVALQGRPRTLGASVD